jgi:hypothetical protein
MQRTTVLTAVATAVVFAVAGWFGGSHTSKVTILKHKHRSADCTGKDCAVDINFDCVDSMDPTTCEAYALQEVILTTANHKIEFTIDKTTNYEFDTYGIKFTSGNAGNYLPCKSDGKQKYRCDIAKDTPPDLYKYQIKVKGMEATDPWIVNR